MAFWQVVDEWSSTPLQDTSLASLVVNVIRVLSCQNLLRQLSETVLDRDTELLLNQILARERFTEGNIPSSVTPPSTPLSPFSSSPSSSSHTVATLLQPFKQFTEEITSSLHAFLRPPPPLSTSDSIVPSEIIIAETLALDMIFLGVSDVSSSKHHEATHHHIMPHHNEIHSAPESLAKGCFLII